MNSSSQQARSTNVVYLIGGLGDTVIAIPALRALREQSPESELLLLYNSDNDGRVTARDVLEGTGLVDEFLSYDAQRGWAESLRILRALRGRRIDTAVYLAPTLRRRRSIVRDRWFFRLAGAGRFAGFAPLGPGVVHEGEGRLERLRRSGIPVSSQACAIPLLRPATEALDRVATWLEARGGRVPLVAIAPGSQMPSKHWPIERFAELGKRLRESLATELVIVGGPAERQAGEFLRSAWGGGLNGAGAFSVAETAALLSRVELLVTLDTGPMHLAAAVGIPCIALFSAIEAGKKWDPLGDGHIVIRKPVNCAGCRVTVCPREDHLCMTEIGVDEVWRAVQAKSVAWRGVCTV